MVSNMELFDPYKDKNIVTAFTQQDVKPESLVECTVGSFDSKPIPVMVDVKNRVCVPVKD
jgi:hypothetical protein